MTSVRRPNAQGDAATAAFQSWVRRVVTGAAELRALDDGELDAIVDPETGTAILLPDAQVAMICTNRTVRSVFDAFPGQVCVLDGAGTVVMTNDAWRVFGAGRAGAGLSVREGDNFLEACRVADAAERPQALAVAAGLRRVLAGSRAQFRFEYSYESSAGRCAFTLVIAGIAGHGATDAVVTRENVRERTRIRATEGAGRIRRNRIAAQARMTAPNRLLAALPTGEYERLLVDLEPVRLSRGEILYEPGQPMRHVYFPGDCVVSLLTIIEGRRALEVGLIGNEGVVGTRLAFGIVVSSVRALVQGTGSALRISAASFLAVFSQCPTLQRLMLLFADTLLVQVRQTAACNCFHVVEERLARCLLMTRERLPTCEFHLTHEFLADMLGVRRVGVTAAASSLRRRKLIRYRRGDIRILDQKGLEAAACACYRNIRIVDPVAPAA